MNQRIMLGIVALVVLVGMAVFFTGGSSLLDRIESADSCTELVGDVLPDVRDSGSSSAQRAYTERARALNCGG